MSVQALLRAQTRPLVRPLVRFYGADSPAGAYLGGEPAGLSIDFSSDSALVRGHTTNFNGRPQDLLTVTRASGASYFDKNGVLQQAANNILRLDYHPVMKVPLGALIEEQRTNLDIHSDDLSNAAWVKNAATVSANTGAGPTGVVNADTLTASAGTGTIPRVTNGGTTVTSTVYTRSVYLKAGTYSFAQIYINNQAADYANFNLATGVATAAGAATALMQPLLNGWYRCSITFTAGSTDRTTFIMLAASATATRAQTWNPVGTETIIFGGTQTEAGA